MNTVYVRVTLRGELELSDNDIAKLKKWPNVVDLCDLESVDYDDIVNLDGEMELP